MPNQNVRSRLNSQQLTVTPYEASPQQGDPRLSGPPSVQATGDTARTRDRKVPADHRADSLSTMPPPPPIGLVGQINPSDAYLFYSTNVDRIHLVWFLISNLELAAKADELPLLAKLRFGRSIQYQ
ncbi:hypothetical protein PoB_006423600 [Plakobranchus ocellatus]|uniref:Uncharacterized protein n=1 Tax=Plakobranchus ocellatus TaxID=259542 RepID=A0AAV4D0Y0_9GAST|nr:hypothetical protein PoB_006423600 [Plakobranchus ocellatus]